MLPVADPRLGAGITGGNYLGLYALVLGEGPPPMPSPTPPGLWGECTCDSIEVTYLVTADVQCVVTVTSGERCPA